MRITILVDNSPSAKNHELGTEHGLSLYIEYGNRRILCDTGTSSLFAKNAYLMGIDIDSCSFAFISHGHNDHIGGLEYFIEKVNDKKIYMHSSILHDAYFSTRHGERRNLNIDSKFLSDSKERIHPIDTTTEIAEGIFAVQCKTSIYPTPYGNCFLWKKSGKKEEKDTFRHEISLAFITDKGLVIVSPCSHCGALNIIRECQNATRCSKVYTYIGGLHFVESENCISEATTFAKTAKKEFPNTLFLTGHCTCNTAKEILEQIADNIKTFSTGSIIEL